MISLREANQKVLNKGAKHSDYSVGDRVKVVCLCQDFYFFNPETQNTKGTVIRNSGSGIGIIVKWDEPREYEDGHIQEEFNFGPEDLIKLQEENKELKNEIDEAEFQRANSVKVYDEYIKKLQLEIKSIEKQNVEYSDMIHHQAQIEAILGIQNEELKQLAKDLANFVQETKVTKELLDKARKLNDN